MDRLWAVATSFAIDFRDLRAFGAYVASRGPVSTFSGCRPQKLSFRRHTLTFHRGVAHDRRRSNVARADGIHADPEGPKAPKLIFFASRASPAGHHSEAGCGGNQLSTQ